MWVFRWCCETQCIYVPASDRKTGIGPMCGGEPKTQRKNALFTRPKLAVVAYFDTLLCLRSSVCQFMLLLTSLNSS